MQLDISSGEWINRPRRFQLTPESLTIETEPLTDLWQRTYYGFRNDNAPALLLDSTENFTFTLSVSFDYRTRFDQCGVIIYLDSENWFKASIEYENQHFSRLGSVVTNLGYSDWATTDIETPEALYYRLHRRGPDFLIEASKDDLVFKQMRIFHLVSLGESSQQTGKFDLPPATEAPLKFGMYACSPGESSFSARFTDFKLQPCQWKAHAE